MVYSAYPEPTEVKSLLISSPFSIFPLPPLPPEMNMKKISSGGPAARTAANLSAITILKRNTCIHRNRKPSQLSMDLHGGFVLCLSHAYRIRAVSVDLERKCFPWLCFFSVFFFTKKKKKVIKAFFYGTMILLFPQMSTKELK